MAAPQSVIQRAFAAGELAPALAARADLVKYTTGLRRCRNFLVQRHGGVTNRAGTRFIAACKTTSSNVTIERYVSDVAGESMLLEIGASYIRFYVNGAQLQVDPATIDPWDIAVAYVIGDLVIDGGTIFYCLVANTGVATTDAAKWYPFVGNAFELPNTFNPDRPNVAQSGRTITLTHKSHAPRELVNGGAMTSWILRNIDTAPSIAAPAGLTFTPGGAGTRTMAYVVTAAATDTYEESLPSGAHINVACADPTPAAPNALSWTASAGAAEYNIYADPYGNGTYGYIGTATGATVFNDPGILPDFNVTPPLPHTMFTAVNAYPAVAATFQQRRIFANTNNAPDGLFGSRTGFPSNFGISSPLQDDDAITFRMAGNNHHAVQHLVALKSLIVLTGAGEWTVTSGAPNQPLTPSAINADQQTYVGANDVPPVVIGNSIVYVQARGRVLCDLQFDLQVEGLGGRDLSIFADHLFKLFTITDLDYAQTPHSIVWAIRSDGTLLGLTYIREQDVWGWHRHDTGASGRFEHVCVVPEADQDAVYVIVRRTIGGVTKRYLERLEPRDIATFDTDCFFVDAGLSYSGAPVTNVTGLDHLNGQVVAVVGDGAVIFNGDATAANAANFTVAAGTLPVALPAAYSNIHVGLPITAEIETLDVDVQGSTVRDKQKRVSSVTLLLEDSSRAFLVGPDTAHLTRYQLKPAEAAADAYTGPAEISTVASFTPAGRVFIRHDQPLPLTVLGIIPSMDLGG